MTSRKLLYTALPCVQRALLGKVTPSLRGVTVGITNGVVQVYCYFDGDPSEQEAEDMGIAAAELHADFPGQGKLEFKVMRCDHPKRMPRLDRMAYHRKENEDA